MTWRMTREFQKDMLDCAQEGFGVIIFAMLITVGLPLLLLAWLIGLGLRLYRFRRARRAMERN